MTPPKRFGLLLSVLLPLLIFLPGTARAICLAHPTDAGAVLLGSFSLAAPFPPGGGNVQNSCEYRIEVCAWLLSSSRVDYILNAGSIDFSGDCDAVDSLPFASIMDYFSYDAVKRGTELGYTECGDTFDVWVAHCVERSGSGEETTFDPCSTMWCKRRYTISCGAEGTSYLPLLEDTAVCVGVSGGCERGCAGTE